MRASTRTLPLLLITLALLGTWTGVATAQDDRSAVDETVLAALAPALLGPTLSFLAPALFVVWLVAQPVLRDEGVRSLRRIRAR